MTLRFDYSFPTLNEYIDVERRNRFAAAKLKSKATEAAKLSVFAQTRKTLNGLFDVKIRWVRVNNRHDPDNVYFGAKFILDGMVNAQLLKGDSRKHIRNISHTIENGKSNYCEVTLRLVSKS